MATTVEIPALGESITEAVIAHWRKADGEQVAVDEPLCELETDKANVDLPAPIAGVVRRLKAEGETVRVGEAVAEIEASATAKQPQSKAEQRPAGEVAPPNENSVPAQEEKPAPREEKP